MLIGLDVAQCLCPLLILPSEVYLCKFESVHFKSYATFKASCQAFHAHGNVISFHVCFFHLQSMAETFLKIFLSCHLDLIRRSQARELWRHFIHVLSALKIASLVLLVYQWIIIVQVVYFNKSGTLISISFVLMALGEKQWMHLAERICSMAFLSFCIEKCSDAYDASEWGTIDRFRWITKLQYNMH